MKNKASQKRIEKALHLASVIMPEKVNNRLQRDTTANKGYSVQRVVIMRG